MGQNRKQASMFNANQGMDHMGLNDHQNNTGWNSWNSLGPLSRGFTNGGGMNSMFSAGQQNNVNQQNNANQGPFNLQPNIQGNEAIMQSQEQLNNNNLKEVRGMVDQFPALGKYAAQDNNKDQRSSTGEDNGVSFTTRDEDHATGTDAWDSLSKFMKTGREKQAGGGIDKYVKEALWPKSWPSLEGLAGGTIGGLGGGVLGAGGAAGATIGGLHGLFSDPGEDEEGERRSRLWRAVKGLLGGGALGVAGAGAGLAGGALGGTLGAIGGYGWGDSLSDSANNVFKVKQSSVLEKYARAPLPTPRTNEHGFTNRQVRANVDNSATQEQLLNAHKATPQGSGAGTSTPSGSHFYAGSRQGIPRNLDFAKEVAHQSRNIGQFIGGAPNALSNALGSTVSKAVGGKGAAGRYPLPPVPGPGVPLDKGGIDKYAKQPADQTPRHHCHGVHPDQTHEEWKASLEKESAQYQLKEAGCTPFQAGFFGNLIDKNVHFSLYPEAVEKCGALVGDDFVAELYDIDVEAFTKAAEGRGFGSIRSAFEALANSRIGKAFTGKGHTPTPNTPTPTTTTPTRVRQTTPLAGVDPGSTVVPSQAVAPATPVPAAGGGLQASKNVPISNDPIIAAPSNATPSTVTDVAAPPSTHGHTMAQPADTLIRSPATLPAGASNVETVRAPGHQDALSDADLTEAGLTREQLPQVMSDGAKTTGEDAFQLDTSNPAMQSGKPVQGASPSGRADTPEVSAATTTKGPINEDLSSQVDTGARPVIDGIEPTNVGADPAPGLDLNVETTGANRATNQAGFPLGESIDDAIAPPAGTGRPIATTDLDVQSGKPVAERLGLEEVPTGTDPLGRTERIVSPTLDPDTPTSPTVRQQAAAGGGNAANAGDDAAAVADDAAAALQTPEQVAAAAQAKSFNRKVGWTVGATVTTPLGAATVMSLWPDGTAEVKYGDGTTARVEVPEQAPGTGGGTGEGGGAGGGEGGGGDLAQQEDWLTSSLGDWGGVGEGINSLSGGIGADYLIDAILGKGQAAKMHPMLKVLMLAGGGMGIGGLLSGKTGLGMGGLAMAVLPLLLQAGMSPTQAKEHVSKRTPEQLKADLAKLRGIEGTPGTGTPEQLAGIQSLERSYTSDGGFNLQEVEALKNDPMAMQMALQHPERLPMLQSAIAADPDGLGAQMRQLQEAQTGLGSGLKTNTAIAALTTPRNEMYNPPGFEMLTGPNIPGMGMSDSDANILMRLAKQLKLPPPSPQQPTRVPMTKTNADFRASFSQYAMN